MIQHQYIRYLYHCETVPSKGNWYAIDETKDLMVVPDVSFIYKKLGLESFYGTIAKVGILDKRTERLKDGEEIRTETRSIFITDDKKHECGNDAYLKGGVIMTLFKRGIGLLTTLIMIVNIFTIVPFETLAAEIEKSETAAEEFTFENFKYSISSNNVNIISYSGSSEKVTVPETIDGKQVVSISNYAFQNNASIKEVVLPDSIESLGSFSFRGCKNLKEINIPKNWNTTPSTSSSSTNTTYCGHIFEGCEKLTSITVPEGMEEIPSFGFNACNYLEEVILPDSLTNIKNQAFYDCVKLNSVIIPEKVGSIGKSAFCHCTSLKELDLPQNIKTISIYAFDGCTSLERAALADSIESLGSFSFRDCKNLKEINIPKNWNTTPSTSSLHTDTTYCGHIFEGCEKLTSITAPEGMEEIPSFGFNACNYLKEINLPDTLTKINKYAFYGCTSLNSVSIPAVVSLDSYVFARCSELKNVKIETKLTQIPDHAFYVCTGLEKINIPDTVSDIGDYAFSGCVSIKSIEIPKTLEGIGEYAFFTCAGLEEISLYPGVKSIGSNAFHSCSNLTIKCLPGSVAAEYAEKNGVPFEYSLTSEYTISVKDENGDRIEDGYEIKWYVTGSDQPVAEGNKLDGADPAKTYECQIVLNDNLKNYYSQPTRIQISNNASHYEYSLVPLKTWNIQGKVLGSDNRPVHNAELVFTQTKKDGNVFTVQGYTDESGEFEVKLLDEGAVGK